MSFALHTGDSLDVLRTLPSESVHTVVTSPPYFGLRDYGVDGQIGLEESLEDWVERLVDVFAEARRVLRNDGTLWLNLGDSFGEGKQLLGQPWRVAFALQARGWVLRMDVVWSKPNPMPESITDRPTKSHEYLFLFAKSDRYFYDNDAIREPYKPASVARRQYADVDTGKRISGHQPHSRTNGNNLKQPGNGHTYFDSNPAGRNRRSVWEIPTARFDQAHFATFPEKLVEPCIMAGASEGGCCSACGAPRKRHIELGDIDRDHQAACGADSSGEYHGISTKHGETAADYDRLKRRQSGERKKAVGGGQNPSDVKARILAGMRERKTTGWDPTCACVGAGVVPCTVLDPFSGSGTTGAVALRLGRRYIGIELNAKYQEEIARPRLLAASSQGLLRFDQVVP